MMTFLRLKEKMGKILKLCLKVISLNTCLPHEEQSKAGFCVLFSLKNKNFWLF